MGSLGQKRTFLHCIIISFIRRYSASHEVSGKINTHDFVQAGDKGSIDDDKRVEERGVVRGAGDDKGCECRGDICGWRYGENFVCVLREGLPFLR